MSQAAWRTLDIACLVPLSFFNRRNATSLFTDRYGIDKQAKRKVHKPRDDQRKVFIQSEGRQGRRSIAGLCPSGCICQYWT
ncbi:hypothetical protein N8843_01245 [Verrucomicrobia bacterium]|nr:hypothetical protein [Verrucomicrobiota bacterium]